MVLSFKIFALHVCCESNKMVIIDDIHYWWYMVTLSLQYHLLTGMSVKLDFSKSSICAATWQNQQNGMFAQRRLRSDWANQPGHSPSLIRVFAVRKKKAWILSYPLSAQRRLCSDWAGAQAGLSLRWAHRSLCWFCHEAALLFFFFFWKKQELYDVHLNCRDLKICGNSEDTATSLFLAKINGKHGMMLSTTVTGREDILWP